MDQNSFTILYSAGCTDTQNSFEYYFIDNRTSELLTSGYFFLEQFYESLYDLWAQTKLAELDNKTIDTTAYYEPKWEWAPNQIHVKNCAVSNQTVVLTKDNNTVTIELPTGYAGFRADFMKTGYINPIERTGTRGKLIEGDNTIRISTIRGTWNFSTPFVPQIQEAKDFGIKNISKIHITGGNFLYDFGSTLSTEFIKDTIPADNITMWNTWWIDKLGQIASKYAGTNIYKTQGEPYRTAYYGAIYEVYFDNGTIKGYIPVSTLLNIAQGFTGGTSATSNWNGLDDRGFEEIPLPSGKEYHAFILGYKINVDNNTVTNMTKEPITIVNGDNMSGWILEVLSKVTGTCYLKTEAGWEQLNSCEPPINASSSNIKSAAMSAISSKIKKSTLYPNQSSAFCIDNITSRYTDLMYQDAICYNSTTKTYRYPNNYTPPCSDNETPIRGAYIKGEFTESVDKVCMTPFTATRASKFDLSNLVSTVEVVITNKK